MSVRQAVSVALVCIWLAQDTALAAQKAALTWSELGPVVVEKKAKVRLNTGVSVEGEVLAVRPGELIMDVTRTSDKKTYPKGQTSIARASVKEFRLIKEHGPGKLIGGILGAVGGVFTASAMTYYGYAAGALTGFFVVLPCMAVGGYYLGKLADIRTTRIALVPEPDEVGQSQPAPEPGEEELQ